MCVCGFFRYVISTRSLCPVTRTHSHTNNAGGYTRTPFHHPARAATHTHYCFVCSRDKPLTNGALFCMARSQRPPSTPSSFVCVFCLSKRLPAFVRAFSNDWYQPGFVLLFSFAFFATNPRVRSCRLVNSVIDVEITPPRIRPTDCQRPIETRATLLHGCIFPSQKTHVILLQVYVFHLYRINSFILDT